MWCCTFVHTLNENLRSEEMAIKEKQISNLLLRKGRNFLYEDIYTKTYTQINTMLCI